MPDQRQSLSLERRVLAAFRQACAEQALEVADRLLSILDLMDRQQAGDAGLGPGRDSSTLADAYRIVAAASRGKH